MKRIAAIGTLCVVIGFGAGWLARRPTSDSSVPGPDAPQTTPSETAGSGPSSGSPVGNSPSTTAGDRSAGASELGDAAREQQERLRSGILARQRAAHEARIAGLVKSLGLSPEQEATLKTFYADNREKLGRMLEPEFLSDPSVAMETAALVRGAGFDELIAGLLTAAQKISFEKFKMREQEDMIGAETEKNLSRLEEVVSLTDEQKKRVFKLLQEETGAAVTYHPEARALMGIWESVLQIEVDPEDLGVAAAVQAQMVRAREAKGAPDNPQEWLTIVERNLDARVQQKVRLFSGVLNAQQQALYRQHLEAQAKSLRAFSQTSGRDASAPVPR